ncbi:hypothetical protein QJS10_CPB20g02026 [Acorus calamus]|uniref:DUF7356 domain-containing protein n=1 Tax=Acorus calamus TaxID=4465 RepID=A0AAV9CDZ8_ACOCL|nr:hypothetical protein QJS10_CPB20g02026 [Acorus calamus]
MSTNGVRFAAFLLCLFFLNSNCTETQEIPKSPVAVDPKEDNGDKDVVAKVGGDGSKIEVPKTGKEGLEGRSDGGDGSDSEMKGSDPVKKREECEGLSGCSVEKSELVACLRATGDELSELSLLIQNKGKDSISVNISAPDSIVLEKGRVNIPKEEDKKVTVSLKDGVNDTVITLTTKHGHCDINFQDMISDAKKVIIDSTQSKGTTFLTRSTIIYVFLIVILVAGVAWAYAWFRQKHRHGSGFGYQKLENELPVSVGWKAKSESDGWDDNWGDGWDEEEAPMTPSKPVANLSSKGLASRRSNKDGWHS